MSKEAIAKLEDSLSKKNLLIYAIYSGLFCGIVFGICTIWGHGFHWRRILCETIPFCILTAFIAPGLKVRIVQRRLERIKGNKISWVDQLKAHWVNDSVKFLLGVSLMLIVKVCLLYILRPSVS